MSGITTKEGTPEKQGNQGKTVSEDRIAEAKQSITLALSFLDLSSVTVVQHFIGVSVNDPDDIKGIVVYEGFLQQLPPMTNIIWKYNITDNDSDDTEDWLGFKAWRYEAYCQLLRDFQDQVFINIIRDYPDVLSIYPSVKRSDTGAYEPVIVITKRLLDYSDVTGKRLEDLIKDSRIILSNGESVQIELIEGAFLDRLMKKPSGNSPVASVGSSRGREGKEAKQEETAVEIPLGEALSLNSLEAGYGTVGGLVTYEGKDFLITNHHVIHQLQAAISFQSGPMEFVVPPIFYRRDRLVDSVYSQERYRGNRETILRFLLSHKDSRALKSHLNVGAERVITLDDLNRYFYEGMVQFNSDSADLIHLDNLDPLPVELLSLSSSPILVTSDLSLVPLGSGFFRCGCEKKIGDPYRLIALQNLLLDKTIKEIKVFKRGATTDATEGVITRPIHLADHESTLSKHYLFNQLVIAPRTETFAKEGDSGSLVYCEDHTLHPIGTFVGRTKSSQYIASPIDVLLSIGAQFKA